MNSERAELVVGTYAYNVAQVSDGVRTYNRWIVLEPSGNYYRTSNRRLIAKGDVVVAVVRKGTTTLERILPKSWS